MSSDNLFAILAMIRAEIGDEVSDETWDKIKRMLGAEAGGSRVYVPAQPKRARLETLTAAGDAESTQQLSRLLGVSVRRVQQLKRLRG